MRYAEATFDKLFPTAEELWERGGAEYQDVELEPGHVASDVPFFDVALREETVPSVAERPFITRRRGKIGRIVTHNLVLADGVDRSAWVYLVNGSRDDFTHTAGAAWFTHAGPHSYNSDRMSALTATTMNNGIIVGAQHSGKKLPTLLEWMRLPATARQAYTRSLARSAQEKQLIINTLANYHGLAKKQYKRADSMDDMETSGEYVYADMYGMPIVQHDTHARCGFEDLELGDMGRFVDWVKAEFSQLPSIGFDLLREHRLRRVIGTVSLNPNFLTSSIVGAMPALASDEANRMVDWMRPSAYGHQTIMTGDGMSSVAWLDRLGANHSNVHAIAIPGRHLDIVRPAIRRAEIDRAARYSREFQSHNGNVQLINRTLVYDGPDAASVMISHDAA